MKKRFFGLACLALAMAFSATAFAACGDNTKPSDKPDDTQQGGITDNNPGDKNPETPGDGTDINTGIDANKTVSKIEVKTLPSKTEYVKGDTFDPSGGVLTITYTDNTTSDVSMTAEGVTFNNPNMSTVGDKNVRATVGGKNVTFKIKVVDQTFTVKFDYNYEGDTDIEVSVNSGNKVTAQTAERTGYEFINWYVNADYTQVVDFDAPITANATYYALWVAEGAAKVDVTFHYNYYGIKLDEYTYPVASGSKVAKPSNPSRAGYEFVGWTTDEGNTADYDFNSGVSAATHLYAKWNKTASRTEYVFEAEDTDLTGKVGPGYSGTAQEESMIVTDTTHSVSNNRYVSYLMQKDCSLEFYIASDEDVTDAQIVLRLSCDNSVAVSFDGTEFQVLVNGVAQTYQTININSVTGVSEFRDFTISASVRLKKGENLIQLKTNNTKAIEGTTFKAHAPAVDCLKITTSAVLIWDENHGLPKGNY